jgi:hypothetical protein
VSRTKEAPSTSVHEPRLLIFLLHFYTCSSSHPFFEKGQALGNDYEKVDISHHTLVPYSKCWMRKKSMNGTTSKIREKWLLKDKSG